MQGRIHDFGNGGPISVNSSYLLGDLPPNSKFPLQKNTQTHKKMHQIYHPPPPPDMWFPQSTKSRINIGPISEGETRIEGGKRAKIDGESKKRREPR